MESLSIRVFGDPVLKRVSEDVQDIDGALASLCGRMFEAMYQAPGIGLAAPQVGVSQRFFVYDYGDGPKVLINPEIVESHGEWEYDEGCLSVPGLSWNIVRPKQIHIVGYGLDGEEISIEADELESRLYQHEIDHLDGKLLLDYLDDDEKKKAKKILREMIMGQGNNDSSGPGRVQFP
ncbi:MAG: peptide deformylase [Acidimicrobiales bacterium]|nr:peptide deformylase [Acidimicrobiales bacterium]